MKRHPGLPADTVLAKRPCLTVPAETLADLLVSLSSAAVLLSSLAATLAIALSTPDDEATATAPAPPDAPYATPDETFSPNTIATEPTATPDESKTTAIATDTVPLGVSHFVTSRL
jgi:hypothetical protein